MKNSTLDVYDLQDMSKHEMQQTDGGGLLLCIAVAIVLFLASAQEAR